MPPQHSARADGPSISGRFYWDCPQRGCFSGFRYKTMESAQKAATKHNEEGAAEDERVQQQMFGPARKA